MPQQQNILKFIPQRPPFVFVDDIVSVTDKQTITTFHVKEGNLFCKEGIFYEAGMIENIAQTVAAGSGYRLNEKNEKPKIGLIGAVKNLKVFCRPKAGCSIRTVTELITNFKNAMVVQGTIFDKEKPIVTCQMNIFIIDHPNF
jgi:predicted hotdog family 3-hydroxylacyl-ACP dehydratase